MSLRKWGWAVVTGASFGIACSTTETTTNEAPRIEMPGSGGESETSEPARAIGQANEIEEVGSFRGDWDGKELTFTRLSGATGLTPKAFITVPDANLNPTTVESCVVNTACPQNAGPRYFTSATPTTYLGNGQPCPDGHLCAIISLTNNSTRDIDRVFAQITSNTAGFEADGHTIAAVPPGYPLSNTRGLWDYGTLVANGGGYQQQWNFKLPNCNTFSFKVKLMGTVRRTSYVAQRSTLSSQAEWIDACNLPGMTRILVNAGPGTVVSDIPLPFPFTLYDLTLDSDQFPALNISSNGALGFLPITTDNVTLPDLSNNSDYSMFPFWDTLQLGSSGVCYASTGTTPNRKFVVTWKDADIVGTAATENLTFSAVLNETSDIVQYYYNRYSNTNAANNCFASATPNRGGGATIGIQGVGAAAALYSFNNGSALPPHAGTCPGNLERITLTPSPNNSF